MPDKNMVNISTLKSEFRVYIFNSYFVFLIIRWPVAFTLSFFSNFFFTPPPFFFFFAFETENPSCSVVQVIMSHVG